MMPMQRLQWLQAYLDVPEDQWLEKQRRRDDYVRLFRKMSREEFKRQLDLDFFGIMSPNLKSRMCLSFHHCMEGKHKKTGRKPGKKPKDGPQAEEDGPQADVNDETKDELCSPRTSSAVCREFIAAGRSPPGPDDWPPPAGYWPPPAWGYWPPPARYWPPPAWQPPEAWRPELCRGQRVFRGPIPGSSAQEPLPPGTFSI